MSRGARCIAASAALLCASLLCAARGVASIGDVEGIASAAMSEPHAAAARFAAAEMTLSAPLAAIRRMLPEPAAAKCDCSRTVAAAVAATFCATAAAAAAVTAVLLRSRQLAVSVPRRRLRGAAALGLARAANTSPKQQHAGEP
jgi:hypothetical protein